MGAEADHAPAANATTQLALFFPRRPRALAVDLLPSILALTVSMSPSPTSCSLAPAARSPPTASRSCACRGQPQHRVDVEVAPVCDGAGCVRACHVVTEARSPVTLSDWWVAHVLLCLRRNVCTLLTAWCAVLLLGARRAPEQQPGRICGSVLLDRAAAMRLFGVCYNLYYSRLRAQ